MIDSVTNIPTFGVFGKAVTRFDKKEAHKVAIKRSYIRMKRNPRMSPNQLSDAYYNDRIRELNKKGILRGGFISQYFRIRTKR